MLYFIWEVKIYFALPLFFENGPGELIRSYDPAQRFMKFGERMARQQELFDMGKDIVVLFFLVFLVFPVFLVFLIFLVFFVSLMGSSSSLACTTLAKVQL